MLANIYCVLDRGDPLALLLGILSELCEACYIETVVFFCVLVITLQATILRGDVITNLIASILEMLSKLSEGTSIYRVIEGLLVLLSLASTLLISLIFDMPSALIPFGTISIYGFYHLRRCRNLYQSYLWGVEGAGYRLRDRSIYRSIIAFIMVVEILMIFGGVFVAVAPLLSLDPGIATIIAESMVISFGFAAIAGHFTRVRLYRIFASKVLGSG